MNKLKNVILWIVSCFLILSACIYINQIIVPSIVILFLGFVILPPINEKIKKFMKSVNFEEQYVIVRNILIIVGIIIFASFIPANESIIENNQIGVSESGKELEKISTEINNVDKSKIDELLTQVISETNGKYTGDIVNGKKQGHGKYEWNTGEIYEGEFSDDTINGTGTLTIPEKGTYIGAFTNGVKNGEGKFQFVNGDTYQGNWENDKMSGTGTYTFANGDKYEGAFADNQFNGQGTYTKDGSNYIGTWENNEYKK